MIQHSNILKVAAAEATPSFLNKDESIQKACDLIMEAGNQGAGSDPESSGQLGCSADGQRCGTKCGGCTDNTAGVMNSQCGPKTKLMLIELKKLAERRENDQRDSVQGENRSE